MPLAGIHGNKNIAKKSVAILDARLRGPDIIEVLDFSRQKAEVFRKNFRFCPT